MGTQTRPEGKARIFGENIESDLASRFLRVVEVAAIASARTMGQGERKLSDQVATEAMRRTMDTIPMRGTIVIGEGERDEAPMLYIGRRSAPSFPTARKFRESISPSIRWKAPTCVPPARPARLPSSLPPSTEACSMRPIATWKKSWSARPARMQSSWMRRLPTI
jgi:hypothetical protein